MHSQPIPGTLLILQVWKADEYYFFRVKPLPGTCIIDLLGQMRTGHDCEMFFTDNQHVMVNITDNRILVFDAEAYLVHKNCPLYSAAPQIVLESPMFRRYKYFVLQDRDDGRISLVQEQEDHPDVQVLEEPFSLESLESDLRLLSNAQLVALLALDKLGPAAVDAAKDLGDSMRLHREHMLLTKSGFLVLLASCVFAHVEDHHSIFEKPADSHGSHASGDKKEDFTYESSQKVFGHFSYRNIHIVVVVCRSKTEQSQLCDSRVVKDAAEAKSMAVTGGLKGRAETRAPLALQPSLRRKHSQPRSASPADSADEGDHEVKPMNFSFAVVDQRLIWVNFEQKRVWELDLTRLLAPDAQSLGKNQQRESGEGDLKLSARRSSKTPRKEGHCLEWSTLPCKSFQAAAIFQGMSAEEFEESGVRIHEIGEQSAIRLKKIAEAHDDLLDLVQFSACNTAIVVNLTAQKPFIVEMCHDLD